MTNCNHHRKLTRIMQMCAYLLLLFGVSCQNKSATFTGDFGGTYFSPTGTVFGYVDNNQLVVFMSWSIFDPTTPSSSWNSTFLQQLKKELANQALLVLIFPQSDALRTGETLSAVAVTSTQATTGNFIPFIQMPNLASERKLTLSVESLPSGQTAQAFKARLRIDAVRSAEDPQNSLVGSEDATLDVALVETATVKPQLAALVDNPTLRKILGLNQP